MPEELVKVVTNPARPASSIKMTRKQAADYIKANPGAAIMDAPAPEPETKAVDKAEDGVEDKAVHKAENKAAKK